MRYSTKRTSVLQRLFLIASLFFGTLLNVQAQCEKLIWADEFNGTSLDTTKWNYEVGGGGWGTGQLDYSTARPENVRLENGKLVLELRKEEYGGQSYTSGRLNTYNKFNCRYGKFEARIKGVNTKSLGVAFWLLGADYKTTIWPKCGEIDIFEQTGKSPNYNIGTAHFAEAWGHASNQGNITLPNDQRFCDDYHTMGIEWGPDSIRWYCDGVYYHTMNISKPINGYDPFNRPFYIIMSVGVGGSLSGDPDATTVLPQQVLVDYIRVTDGAYSCFVDGDKRAYQNEKDKIYTAKEIAGATYSWTVPAGATYVQGDKPNQIKVNFGANSGDVSCTITQACGTQKAKVSVLVEKPIVVSNTFENFEDVRPTYGYISGQMSVVANPASNQYNSSTTVGKYIRNSGTAWDAVVMQNIVTGPAGEYIQGKKRFFLDVYTDAPVGTKITLGLENSKVAVPEQPWGKHSSYETFTKTKGAWQTLEFQLNDIPDKYTGNYNVDKFVLMFDPGNSTGNTYYFDNLRAGISGGEPPILSTEVLENWDGKSSIKLGSSIGVYQPNQANPSPSGINTSANVLKYQRNAGNQYDNITYKIAIDDASFLKSGDNTIAFDLFTGANAGKIVSIHLEDSTINGANDWQAPIHSIYEGKTTKVNQWETIDFKWSSTPNASVPNVHVNRMVILIDEKANSGDTYYIDNIRFNSRLIKGSLIPSKVIEDYDANRNLEFVYTGEVYKDKVANPSKTGINTSDFVGQYERKYVPNDWLVFNVKTSLDGKALREKTKVWSVDVYTDAPAGQLITIGLEASAYANSENWPTGRHSDYAGVTKEQNKWHTVNFVFSNSSDPSTPDDMVNKMIFTCNQGTQGNYTYYFDNIRLMESVKDTVLNRIDVTPALSQGVNVGSAINFGAAGFDQFNHAFPSHPTWTVSGSGATITSAGVFTAQANGIYKVSATDGNIVGTADVLVGESIKLTKISVSPSSSIIYEGNSLSLQATGFDQLNRVIAFTPTWSVSGTAPASISASGVLTTTGAGTSTVTVAQGSVSATSVITVRATPVLTTLSVSPLTATMYLGDTKQFVASTIDQYGNPITVAQTWTASSGTISNGLFTPSAIGTFSVKVESMGKFATTYITVVEKPTNIALNKLPVVSSSQAGLLPASATDGDLSTKWGSEWTDAQYLYIDLGNTYDISKVTLRWEAAYGKAYDINVSDNTTDWKTPVFSTEAGDGNVDDIPVTATGRYLRVNMRTRGTGYGYSLYEVEAMGILHTTSVLKSIVIDPYQVSTDKTVPVQLTAKCFDQNGKAFSANLTWSATGGNVSNTGLYTPANTGNFTVSATANGISANAKVIVTGNNPPVVSITAPLSTNTYTAGSLSIPVTGTATDDGSIAKVEVYNGSTKLGDATGSNPYSYTWNATLAAGTYTITVKATDNLGATTQSSVTINVTTPTGLVIPGKIESESYSSMSGVGLETTGDTGGGQNIGWIDANDWMDYPVNVTTAGSYQVSFRVATNMANAQMKLVNGSTTLCTLTVPNSTGGYQSWQTFTANVTLAAGNQTLRFVALTGGFNINWMSFAQNTNPVLTSITLTPNPASVAVGQTVQFTAVGKDQNGNVMSITPTWSVSGTGNSISTSGLLTASTAGSFTVTASSGSVSGTSTVTVNAAGLNIPGKIEAEAYTSMSGIATEATADAGGGQNIGYIDANDYMDYNVNVTAAGTYTATFRVACWIANGQLQLKSGSTVLATVNLPNTSGGQNWQDVSVSVTLPQGAQTLRVLCVTGGFNFNYINFTTLKSKQISEAGPSVSESLRVYPNPVTDQHLTIDLAGYAANEELRISISDISGKTVKESLIQTGNDGAYNQTIELSNFPTGLYILNVIGGKSVQMKKLIVE